MLTSARLFSSRMGNLARIFYNYYLSVMTYDRIMKIFELVTLHILFLMFYDNMWFLGGTSNNSENAKNRRFTPVLRIRIQRIRII